MDNQVQPIAEEQSSIQPSLFELEEFTFRNYSSLDSLKLQLKEAQDMLDSTLKQDSVYTTNEENVKDAQKSFRVVKNQMLKRPEIISLTEKVKQVRNEIKEKKESVSLAALEYITRGGTPEITKEGVTYEIVRVAKIIKRTQ